MAEALWRSGLPHGTVSWLCARVHGLGEVDAEEAVDIAFGELMAKVLHRKEIRNLRALFMKIAVRRAYRLLKTRGGLLPIEGDAGNIAAVLRGGRVESYEEDGVDEEIYRREVIRKARSYLPRLPPSPARVMDLFLSHVETGREDVTAEEIGEILEMAPGTVRTNLSRARARLERFAVEDGLLRAGELAESLGDVDAETDAEAPGAAGAASDLP